MTTTADTTDQDASLVDSIERAADRIGAVWPIHSFVTANPLAGFEDRPFHEAVAEAEAVFGGRGYPHPSVFRQAWETGEIDPAILREELTAHGVDDDPETLLEQMATGEAARTDAADEPTDEVDRICAKWLATFLDQGESKWSMPNREDGFYAAWRQLAAHDSEIPDTGELPETAMDAVELVAADCSSDEWDAICDHQLAALPGWTGFIKQRVADGNRWQETYPITLVDYLAVRLVLSDLLEAPLAPDSEPADAPTHDEPPVAELWLTAWERSYREGLLAAIDASDTSDESARPDAQLVFCIDTRSEVFRRHLEDQGAYETHGYAGFFGVPMRFEGHDSEAAWTACPPIVDPQHHVSDRPADADQEATHGRLTTPIEAAHKHFKTLKTNAVAAFTFVEGAGSAYGSALAARTLFPSTVAKLGSAVGDRIPRPDDFCEADLECDHDHAHGHDHHHHGLQHGMTHEQRVRYAANAFDLMGWTEFARLVVFTGHAAHTTNNPFDSSLDCGACAGNGGGPNARVLAQICNDEAVKADLREQGFEIPEDTVFLAGEHNTTTDAVDLFDAPVPESHADELDELRAALDAAREATAAERAERMPDADASDAVDETERRAFDWAETRPEWGLAGNASFVIGPRDLTADQTLAGRAFLHSYDWTVDPYGEALEAIMTGPLVVTQWINNQYYFATVDNAVYGSGSKVTQNPVGNVGVFQGNGGDLMTGLPLQSLNVTDDDPHHQPLRLSAVIHAPVDYVTDILERHDDVRELLDNGWIGGLTVLDPTSDELHHYQGDLEWAAAPETDPVATVATSTAAD